MLYSGYITKTDLTNRFNGTNLDELTGSNDTILTEVENQALELVAGFTRHWYDMATEFAKTGANRNPVLIRIVCDLILFDLVGRNNSGNVPEYRTIRYDNAMSDLKKIQSGHIQLDIAINEFDTDEDEREDEGQQLTWGTTQTGNNNEY